MCLVTKSKSEKIASLPGYLMLIAVFYQLILLLGEYILLGKFELGDEVLDVRERKTKFQDVYLKET